MLVKFDKQMIASLLKNKSVQDGIDKTSRSILLPEMSTTEAVLEHIGATILHELGNEQ